MSRIDRGPAIIFRSNVFVREIPFHQAHPPDSDSNRVRSPRKVSWTRTIGGYSRSGVFYYPEPITPLLQLSVQQWLAVSATGPLVFFGGPCHGGSGLPTPPCTRSIYTALHTRSTCRCTCANGQGADRQNGQARPMEKGIHTQHARDRNALPTAVDVR